MLPNIRGAYSPSPTGLHLETLHGGGGQKLKILGEIVARVVKCPPAPLNETLAYRI